MENELSKIYHIAICDDDDAYIQYAKEQFLSIKEPGEQFIFYEYHSGEELSADILTRERCDLLFLDIQLKEMNGNTAARIFRSSFPDALLVFCSGVYLPTTESFETTPFRYLLKSYTPARMVHELKQICTKMRNLKPTPVLFGKRTHKNFRIHLAHTEYIEIAKRGSIIHTFCDGEHLTYSSSTKVSEYYKALSDFGFAYAHNSYIVHLNSIVMLTATELELISGNRLTISRSHAKEFKQKFATYLAQKYDSRRNTYD